jgi:hypothetical protein
VVHASSLSRRHLAGEEALSLNAGGALTVVRIDKIRPSDLLNQTVQFLQFRSGASGSCLIRVATYFDDSAGESTTSSTSSMNGENSGNNGSDIDKDNILKPTFDTLTKEG